MLQFFNTKEEYDKFIENDPILKSGILYYIKEDNSAHFSTNNIDGEYKIYDIGAEASILKNLISREITDITIPAGVTKIGNHAFAGCYNLKSITIPEGVTEIGDHAFQSCSLTSITIPEGVIWLTNETFKGCYNLSNITLPNSLNSITQDTFEGCTSLPTENNLRYADTILIEVVDKSLTTYTIKDGTKWIGPSAFKDCTNLTNITIPSSVTKIDSAAFMGCTSLQSITIPSSVTKFDGSSMFKNCTSLQSITIPSSVTKIYSNMFENCTSLTSITISNSVTKIDDGAFKGCSGLQSITIPSSVTSLGSNIFANCTSLTSIKALKTTAPSVKYTTFKDIKRNGTLTVPKGSSGSYNKWMKDTFSGDTEYYLQYYGWTKVEG